MQWEGGIFSCIFSPPETVGSGFRKNVSSSSRFPMPPPFGLWMDGDLGYWPAFFLFF